MDDTIIATASEEELKQVYLYVTSVGLVVAPEKHYRPWRQRVHAPSASWPGFFCQGRVGGEGDIGPLSLLPSPLPCAQRRHDRDLLGRPGAVVLHSTQPPRVPSSRLKTGTDGTSPRGGPSVLNFEKGISITFTFP